MKFKVQSAGFWFRGFWFRVSGFWFRGFGGLGRKTTAPPRHETKKEPAASYSRAGGSRTTLGDEALDFRVRNGNGYGRLSVATGKW